MAVKTITITEEAYRKLARVKRPGESFTDVINRVLVGTRASELAGILKPDEATKIDEEVRRLRSELDRRVRRTARSVQP